MSATKTDEGRESYWYWILISVIAFVTVCGNALVIYLIATRPRLHITPKLVHPVFIDRGFLNWADCSTILHCLHILGRYQFHHSGNVL